MRGQREFRDETVGWICSLRYTTTSISAHTNFSPKDFEQAATKAAEAFRKELDTIRTQDDHRSL
jgi:hypothetical protein